MFFRTRLFSSCPAAHAAGRIGSIKTFDHSGSSRDGSRPENTLAPLKIPLGPVRTFACPAKINRLIQAWPSGVACSPIRMRIHASFLHRRAPRFNESRTLPGKSGFSGETSHKRQPATIHRAAWSWPFRQHNIRAIDGANGRLNGATAYADPGEQLAGAAQQPSDVTGGPIRTTGT